MAGYQFLILTLLGLDVVQQATAECTEQQVFNCIGNPAYDFQVRSRMPVPNIGTAYIGNACTEWTGVTTCLDACRSGDPIGRRFMYEPYEAVAKYICDDTNAYTSLTDVIADGTRQGAWKACSTTLGIEHLDGTENSDVVCPKMRTYMTCTVGVAQESGNAAAGDYIRNLGLKTLEVVDDHYNCNLDSSNSRDSAAGTTEFKSWLCILSFLFFLVQRII